MAIELPPLPFATDALEPYISKRTIDFHYGKHHKAYVEKLNKLIEGTPMDRMELDEIVHVAKEKEKTDVFNNAGQAWNHDFYWSCMAPKSGGPSREIEKLLSKNFGSLDDFKEKFMTSGKKLFGSGWAWLVKDSDGHLKIRALPNAENPLVNGEAPVLTCDVWEHAYYLDYQNQRPQYLEKFWNIVNWNFVEANCNRENKRAFRPSVHTGAHEHSGRIH